MGVVRLRDRLYSTADLGRLLGVGTSTIKRWTDSGLVRCVRTPGGHRKYRVQDVAEAARRLGLGTTDTGPAGRMDDLVYLLLQDDRAALTEKLGVLLQKGDGLSTRQLVVHLHRHGMRLADAVGLLRVSLDGMQVGFQEAACGEYIYRRAEQQAARLARSLADEETGPTDGAPAALVGRGPGERDPLSGSLVRLVLAECGWRVVDLGLDVTASILYGGIASEGPGLVVWVRGHDHDKARDLEYEVVARGSELVVLEGVDSQSLDELRRRTAERKTRLTPSPA